MSLRARIFVLFGGVIVLLVGAQWWLVASLRTDLRAASAEAALEVGSSVLGAIGRSVPAIPLRPATPAAGVEPALELEVAPATSQREEDGVRATVGLAGDDATRATVALPMMRIRPAPGVPIVPMEPARRTHRIPVPVERVDVLGRAFQWRVLAGSLAVLAVGLVVSGWLAHRVTAPLRALADAASAIGEGRFGTEAPRVGEPRLDEAVDAFNRMSHRLAELDASAREAQAREHLTELGEVARGIAHGLRNPLHVVGLTVAGLADAASDATARERLAVTARAQIERIDRTLRSFLQMAAGAGDSPQRVDAFAVAQDVALEATQLAAGRVAVELHDDGARPALVGHAAEIRTALHVLVVNAVEAAPEGGRVGLHVAPLDGGVRFVVEDDGPGIPTAVRGRLFEPHVTTKEQGAGLGLFLAQRIARGRYRGDLALADRDAGGTRAELALRSLDGAADG